VKDKTDINWSKRN